MLFRFCLYGFLKNQQYYDPFLILAFREKGLSFAMIGLLIGFREICINILEVPTGAIADVLGRRRAMISSFVAYIVAFVIFGWSMQLWALFGAMFFFSIGEAFRTGTHKAIIFDWLAREGRADEKTKVYGRTRSWSKMGSAVSVVVAAAIVFATDQGYASIFYLCIIPYAINIVNFLTYPKYLDGPRRGSADAGGVFRALLGTFASLRSRPLRRLLIESMGFEGAFKVTKDYVQPVLKAAALALPVVLGLGERQRTAVLVGAVYFVLYLASSFASRRADWLARRAGSEARGAALDSCGELHHAVDRNEQAQVPGRGRVVFPGSARLEDGRPLGHGIELLVEDGPFLRITIVPHPDRMVVVGAAHPARIPVLGDE